MRICKHLVVLQVLAVVWQEAETLVHICKNVQVPGFWGSIAHQTHSQGWMAKEPGKPKRQKVDNRHLEELEAEHAELSKQVLEADEKIWSLSAENSTLKKRLEEALTENAKLQKALAL